MQLDDEHYGERPPWHDLQLELRGPAVDDLAFTFAERWERSHADRRAQARCEPLLHRCSKHPSAPGLGRAQSCDLRRTARSRSRCCAPIPSCATAIRSPQHGERSIARAYLKAFARARRLVYLEDQYLWSVDATRALRDALARSPELQIVVVVPRYPDPDGALSGEASRIGRERVLDALHEVGHDRVAVYDLENADGDAIYVHSKVCVVDDVWMAVGSDNLNRRSWTHDSELSCSVIDARLDERAPRDPAGLGDGARVSWPATPGFGWPPSTSGVSRTMSMTWSTPLSWFEALRRGAGVLRSMEPRGWSGPASVGPPAGAPVRAGAGRPALGTGPGARGAPRS